MPQHYMNNIFPAIILHSQQFVISMENIFFKCKSIVHNSMDCDLNETKLRTCWTKCGARIHIFEISSDLSFFYWYLLHVVIAVWYLFQPHKKNFFFGYSFVVDLHFHVTRKPIMRMVTMMLMTTIIFCIY